MDHRILLGEPVEQPLLEECLPPEYLIIQESADEHSSSFRIYLVQSVYAKIHAHLSRDPDIESGGILVGHPFQTPDGDSIFVVVSGAILQDSDNRSVGHFTVGPQEIAVARKEMEQKYPGLAAVGWYHSHPGHGIFLSPQDMTIVNSIYNSPWHIALVVDPLHHDEGFFVGPSGEPFRYGWIGLKEEPDIIRAVALYNRVKEAIDSKQEHIAQDALKTLQSLVLESKQFQYWEGEYRDIDELMSTEVIQKSTDPLEDNETGISLSSRLPKPARKQTKQPRKWWPWISFAAAILFVVGLALIIYFRTVVSDQLLAIIVLALYGFVILRVCQHVIMSKLIETEKDGKDTQISYSMYSRLERLVSIIVMMIVFLSWAGFVVIQVLELGFAR